MKKRPAPETEEVETLESAARNFLDTISEMTTEDFRVGKDSDARRRLARALGLEEGDYAL